MVILWDDPGNCPEVIGGADKGGILVREGQALSSKATLLWVPCCAWENSQIGKGMLMDLNGGFDLYSSHQNFRVTVDDVVSWCHSLCYGKGFYWNCYPWLYHDAKVFKARDFWSLLWLSMANRSFWIELIHCLSGQQPHHLILEIRKPPSDPLEVAWIVWESIHTSERSGLFSRFLVWRVNDVDIIWYIYIDNIYTR